MQPVKTTTSSPNSTNAVLEDKERKIKELEQLISSSFKTMITAELTIELQKEILDKMFGFTLVDESDGGEPHYVVYDEDGNEFYGSNENCKYDLSTFGGIIRYAEDRGYKMGYLSCQMDMRKVLGIS